MKDVNKTPESAISDSATRKKVKCAQSHDRKQVKKENKLKSI